MILCNVCAGEVNERMVCMACGTPAGVAYAPAAAHPNVAYAPPSVITSPTQPELKKGAGGKLAVAVLLLAAVAGLGWWGYVARERSLKEQRQREMVEAYGPVTAESVVVRNVDEDGKILSGTRTSFARKEIRYVLFEATLRNNAPGLQGVEGDLDVKYINPKGSVDSADSEGFTLHKPLSISQEYETVKRSGSWGKKSGGIFDVGRWRIELWFKGRKIGETNFTVY